MKQTITATQQDAKSNNTAAQDGKQHKAALGRRNQDKKHKRNT